MSKSALIPFFMHTLIVLLCSLQNISSENAKSGIFWVVPAFFDIPVLFSLELLSGIFKISFDSNAYIPNAPFMAIAGGIQWYIIGVLLAVFISNNRIQK